MNTKPVFHGSDIEKICACYNLKKETVTNFAANVNPLGLSGNVKKEAASHIDLFSTYPDREYTDLRRTIAGYCGTSPDFVLPGNGSSELISLLIETLTPQNTLILGPTYSEYSRELSFSGSRQAYYHLKEERDFQPDIDDLCRTLKDRGCDLLIMCNPNNPTSSAVLSGDIKKLLAFCSMEHIFVMIDETYVEFAPDIAAVTAVPLTSDFSNLCVLRGVSKFFAAPGMRFGYAVTGDRSLLKNMKEKQIPWSLNSLGAFIGSVMLKDTDYIQKTRSLILSERGRMYQSLKSMPAYKTYFPYANFFLLRIMKDGVSSFDVFEECIKNGLMIRDCSSFQCLEGEYVRFCVMMPEDNERLLKVLEDI